MSGKIHPDKMTKKQLRKEVKAARLEKERISNISEEYPKGWTGVHPCVGKCTNCGCAATACGCGIATACGSGCNVMGGRRRKSRRRKRKRRRKSTKKRRRKSTKKKRRRRRRTRK